MTPSIHFSCDPRVRSWESLAGLEFSGQRDEPATTQFSAWCLNPQMAEARSYSVKLLNRDADTFRIECEADVKMHDVGWLAHIARFHTLAEIRFLGIHVAIPKNAHQPAADALELVSMYFETHNLAKPVVHERALPLSNSVVAYEVHFHPLVAS